MFHGRNTGKKALAVRIVKQALDIVNLMTGKNPLEILVDAVMNSGAREDSTRIGTAGAVKKQAVDVSPLRRVNQGLYFLTVGSREASFRTMKTIAECLADELMNAAKNSPNSYAIKKKDEIEKVAKGNRWEDSDNSFIHVFCCCRDRCHEVMSFVMIRLFGSHLWLNMDDKYFFNCK